MNKLLKLNLLLFLLSSTVLSQWVLLDYHPGNIQDVCFFNLSTGCIAGNSVIQSTTNGGVNWYSYGGSGGVFKLSQPFGTTGYAACDGGIIQKSVDNNIHWSTQNTGTTGTFRGISFVNSNTGIAVGYAGLIRYTTSGGTTWLVRAINPAVSLYGVDLLDANNAYAAGTDMPGAYVFKSTDAGVTWNPAGSWNNSVPNSFYSLYSICFLNSSTGFVSGSSQVFSQFNGVVYRTTNSGANWSTVCVSQGNTINAVYFFDQNTGYAVGNNGVIFYTSNSGLNWTSQFSGTSNSLNSIFFINSLTGYAVGTNGTMLKTTNGGITGFGSLGNEVPDKFSLSQNYPNPFNPGTNIVFRIAEFGLVRIVVYDALGREIQTLVNQELASGIYEVDFDGSNLPSGVYYYKLESGSFIETKRMVILK